MVTLNASKLFCILNMCLTDLVWSVVSQSFQISRENLNRRLVRYTFLQETVDNHHDCARACFNFGGRCKSINFNRKNRDCELNSKTRDSVDSSEFENNGGYIFSDITDWPKLMASGCSRENCDDHQVCQPHGKSHFKCVDKANCGEPPPVINSLVSAPVTLDGGESTYVCDYGYEHVGDSTTKKCIRGTWSDETIMCTRIAGTCGEPPSVNNTVLSAPALVTLDGGEATYVCDYGYEHVGDSTTKKCIRGTWSDETVMCTREYCGTLPGIADGYVNFIPDTFHGAMAVYDCRAYDYEITSGNSVRFCGDGLWTGTAPVCSLIPNIGCYIKGRPHEYNGFENITYTGRTCQAWNTDYPHKVPPSQVYFHNYCRAPNQEDAMPWCYTMDPDMFWDLCTVPEC